MRAKRTTWAHQNPLDWIGSSSINSQKRTTSDQVIRVSAELTCGRWAISITCVMAAGGRMGLWAGRSVAEAGCSFTFITWTKSATMSESTSFPNIPRGLTASCRWPTSNQCKSGTTGQASIQRGSRNLDLTYNSGVRILTEPSQKFG